jgi:hypothetical protein
MDTHDIKTMTDGAAVVIGISGFMEWFPPIVALTGGLLTIVWMVIRIYETKTVQKMLGKNAVN